MDQVKSSRLSSALLLAGTSPSRDTLSGRLEASSPRPVSKLGSTTALVLQDFTLLSSCSRVEWGSSSSTIGEKAFVFKIISSGGPKFLLDSILPSGRLGGRSKRSTSDSFRGV